MDMYHYSSSIFRRAMCATVDEWWLTSMLKQTTNREEASRGSCCVHSRLQNKFFLRDSESEA